MPSLVLPQTATYWGAPVPTGFGGTTFDVPKTLPVRWEEKGEEFIDDDGQERLSRAVVFLEDDVQVGGYLLLGTSIVVDPTTVDGAEPIQRFSKMPDIRAANYLRKAWL